MARMENDRYFYIPQVHWVPHWFGTDVWRVGKEKRFPGIPFSPLIGLWLLRYRRDQIYHKISVSGEAGGGREPIGNLPRNGSESGESCIRERRNHFNTNILR